MIESAGSPSAQVHRERSSCRHVLASASDLPSIESITGNIQASASDAEAREAFNETIGLQARQRQAPSAITG
jgi:hypothetical protein